MRKPVEERQFSRDTVFLAQKYHREGMAPKAIAELFCRPVEQVKQILAIRLTASEYGRMEEYWDIGVRRRKRTAATLCREDPK